MLFSLLADAVLVAHLIFIVFAIGGGLLAFWWPRVIGLHLPAVAWAVFVEMTGGICPLTPLEQSLRAAAGSRGYEGDFIDHYLMPVLYPPGLTPETQVLLGAALLALNATIYFTIWRRWYRL